MLYNCTRVLICIYYTFEGDALLDHSNRLFTTKDKDNDSSNSGNCAVNKRGGWWYVACVSCNPTGEYHEGKLRFRYIVTFCAHIIFYKHKKGKLLFVCLSDWLSGCLSVWSPYNCPYNSGHTCCTYAYYTLLVCASRWPQDRKSAQLAICRK